MPVYGLSRKHMPYQDTIYIYGDGKKYSIYSGKNQCLVVAKELTITIDIDIKELSSKTDLEIFEYCEALDWTKAESDE